MNLVLRLRFGEMERDAMLSHGSSAFLNERLFLRSDPYTAPICNICGDFATTQNKCDGCDNFIYIFIYKIRYLHV